MKKTYLLIISVLCLISVASLSTYAVFTANVNIGNIINMTASAVPTTASIQEYERITLGAGESKKIDLNITNSTSESLYYGVWYEMIKPSDINSKITIAKHTNSENPIIGQLTSNQTKTVTLYVSNEENYDIIFNIGTGYSSTNSLNLMPGRVIITQEAQETVTPPASEYIIALSNGNSYTAGNASGLYATN